MCPSWRRYPGNCAVFGGLIQINSAVYSSSISLPLNTCSRERQGLVGSDSLDTASRSIAMR